MRVGSKHGHNSSRRRPEREYTLHLHAYITQLAIHSVVVAFTRRIARSAMWCQHRKPNRTTRYVK